MYSPLKQSRTHCIDRRFARFGHFGHLNGKYAIYVRANNQNLLGAKPDALYIK